MTRTVVSQTLRVTADDKRELGGSPKLEHLMKTPSHMSMAIEKMVVPTTLVLATMHGFL